MMPKILMLLIKTPALDSLDTLSYAGLNYLLNAEQAACRQPVPRLCVLWKWMLQNAIHFAWLTGRRHKSTNHNMLWLSFRLCILYCFLAYFSRVKNWICPISTGKMTICTINAHEVCALFFDIPRNSNITVYYFFINRQSLQKFHSCFGKNYNDYILAACDFLW